MNIHETAIISDKAEIHPTASIGAYCVIGPNVKIGENTKISPYVHIIKNTVIGNNNTISSGAVIGDAPQDLKFDNSETYIEIGDKNLIREFVTIHRASSTERITKIGNNCMFMVGSHVAHDCTVHDNVILTNYACLAGITTVERNAILSAYAAIHQFCRVGKYCMIGGYSKITQDVPPFCMVADNPAKLVAINSIGLKRAGLTYNDLQELKHAFKKLFSSKSQLTVEAKKIAEETDNEHVLYLANFVLNPSSRGILHKRAGEIID